MDNHLHSRTTAPVGIAAAGRFSHILLCLSEARPIVQLIFLLRFVTGAALGLSADSQNLVLVVFGALTWECAVVFVYLLNGAMDMLEDRINDSKRPIAAGILPKAVAMRYVKIAAGLAILGGVLMGGRFLVAILLFMLIGYLYSAPPFQLKRSAGATIVVAVLGGLLTYLGGSISAEDGGGWPQILCALAMSLWMGLVGAVAKDFSDVAGDAAAGRRSLAAILGERPARWTVGATAVTLGGMFVLASFHLAPILIVPALVTLVGAAGVAYCALCSSSHGSRAVRRRPYRAFMTTQYASHGGLALALAI
jgi:4-hydroxybenzoate polyprenyltransferase